jgi:hypothetical protein
MNEIKLEDILSTEKWTELEKEISNFDSVSNMMSVSGDL